MNSEVQIENNLTLIQAKFFHIDTFTSHSIVNVYTQVALNSSVFFYQYI